MDSRRNIDLEIPPGAQFIAVKQETPVWKQIMKSEVVLWDLVISLPYICQEATSSK